LIWVSRDCERKLEERKRQKVVDTNNAKLKDVEANNKNEKAPQNTEEKSLIDHMSNNKVAPQSIAEVNESVKENEIITQKDHNEIKNESEQPTRQPEALAWKNVIMMKRA